MSRVLAQSGHLSCADRCLLSAVKQTGLPDVVLSDVNPKRTFVLHRRAPDEGSLIRYPTIRSWLTAGDRMQFDQLKRRQFIALLGGAAAWPLAARAQQGERMRRIGVLMSLAENDAQGQARLAAFLQGLQQLGWIDGRNVRIDTRWGAGDADRTRRYAAGLVALAPDVILATGSPPVVALQQATRSAAIVFADVGDPVGQGFVETLARPGGNTTGFMLFEYAMGGKWLELLKEIAPGLTRAAV